MIPRLATLIWMCIIAVAMFGLYMVKYRVQDIQKEIASLSKELEAERESLHVVAAEWAYLNRPDRLSALSRKYLELEPMRGDQFGEVAFIPYAGQQVAALPRGVPPQLIPAMAEE